MPVDPRISSTCPIPHSSKSRPYLPCATVRLVHLALCLSQSCGYSATEESPVVPVSLLKVPAPELKGRVARNRIRPMPLPRSHADGEEAATAPTLPIAPPSLSRSLMSLECRNALLRSLELALRQLGSLPSHIDSVKKAMTRLSRISVLAVESLISKCTTPRVGNVVGELRRYARLELEAVTTLLKLDHRLVMGVEPGDTGSSATARLMDAICLCAQSGLGLALDSGAAPPAEVAAGGEPLVVKSQGEPSLLSGLLELLVEVYFNLSR